jgi:hypothetical protein
MEKCLMEYGKMERRTGNAHMFGLMELDTMCSILKERNKEKDNWKIQASVWNS